MKIVLASESPFRRRAMDMLGVPYEVCPSRIDEKTIREAGPADLTRKLAEAKAWKVARERPDAVIVSGDTVASKGAKIYEKPRDLDEAAQFLRELSGILRWFSEPASPDRPVRSLGSTATTKSIL